MSETLPKGWVPVKFTDILEIRGGSQPPKKDFIYEPKEGFVRLLQIRDFGDKPFPTYVSLTSKLRIVGKDELLLARYGGTSKDDSLGRICTGMEGAYNVALVKLLFLPEFTPPGFIKHLFGAHFFLEVISKNSRSCQTGFNKDDLKDVSFPLPPPNRQTAATVGAVGCSSHCRAETRRRRESNRFASAPRRLCARRFTLGALRPPPTWSWRSRPA